MLYNISPILDARDQYPKTTWTVIGVLALGAAALTARVFGFW